MSFLRFAALLLLALWIGGLVALGGIAAPNIFGVLETLDPHSGREAAGRVFGVVFDRFQRLSWALGGVLLLLLIARRMLGPPPRLFSARLAALILMIGISLTTALAITPRIVEIRDGTPGGMATLSSHDPRKLEFGRLHAMSNGLMLLTLLAGLGLFWAETRDLH